MEHEPAPSPSPQPSPSGRGGDTPAPPARSERTCAGAIGGEAAPHWLDRYLDLAGARSPMTPRSFHEGIGLWLISTTIARRLAAHMPHDDVYPNLWVMLIARSTLYAKTTAFNYARKLARRAIPHLLLPDSSTPEAMVELLVGKDLEGEAQAQAGQKGLILDEASGMLSQSGRDYMAGTLELYLRLYDCPQQFERVTRQQGLARVNGPYFTILAASTPAMLAPHLKMGRMWANGWWPRFGLLPQPAEPPPFRRSQPVDEAQEQALVDALAALHRRLPMPVYPAAPQALSVTLAPEVMSSYLKFDEYMRYDVQRREDTSEQLGAVFGRGPTQALKIAMCLAALDWPAGERAPRVEMRHWKRAGLIAVSWAEGAQRALSLAEAQSTDERLARVLRAVPPVGKGWISLRDLCRATHLKASEVEIMLHELQGAGEVETRPVVHGVHATLEARRCEGAGEQGC